MKLKLTEYRVSISIGMGTLVGLIFMSLILLTAILTTSFVNEYDVLLGILVVIIFASISVAASSYAVAIRKRK